MSFIPKISNIHCIMYLPKLGLSRIAKHPKAKMVKSSSGATMIKPDIPSETFYNSKPIPLKSIARHPYLSIKHSIFCSSSDKNEPQPSLLNINQPINLQHISSSVIAQNILTRFSLHQLPIKSFSNLLRETNQFAQMPVLKKIFNSQTMKKILNQKHKYRNFDDLIAAIYKEKVNLAKTLSFREKLKHGIQLTNFIRLLERHKKELKSFSEIYADALEVSSGHAGVEILQYFFANHELPQFNRQVFEYIESHVHKV